MQVIDITISRIHSIYKLISSDAHKGIQGHAMIIGGSYGKIGATVLASKAALRTGCGLVTTFIPKCGYQVLQIANPEVMVLTDKKKKCISKIKLPFIPDAIGIGPGMGQEQETQKALHDFLRNNKQPLVIDADALNILALHQNWFSLLPRNTILTPHHKELERIIGTWHSEEEKFAKVEAFSIAQQVIVVVKGAPTHIIDGQTTYKNTTGNAALATAGSGDVLTGMITSLLAQLYTPIEATILGVYLHGLTADVALPNTGHQSFIASDIIAHIGKAYLHIERDIRS